MNVIFEWHRARTVKCHRSVCLFDVCLNRTTDAFITTTFRNLEENVNLQKSDDMNAVKEWNDSIINMAKCHHNMNADRTIN